MSTWLRLFTSCCSQELLICVKGRWSINAVKVRVVYKHVSQSRWTWCTTYIILKSSCVLVPDCTINIWLKVWLWDNNRKVLKNILNLCETLCFFLMKFNFSVLPRSRFDWCQCAYFIISCSYKQPPSHLSIVTAYWVVNIHSVWAVVAQCVFASCRPGSFL